MGDGQGFVFLTFILDPVGPDAVGQVSPVVFPGGELFPAVFQVLAPLGEAEEFP